VQVENVGYVTYAWTKGAVSFTAVVVAPPLCSNENIEPFLRAFHSDVPGIKIYLTVTKEVAEVLYKSFGFQRNQIGKDHYCDLNIWEPKKKLVKS